MSKKPALILGVVVVLGATGLGAYVASRPTPPASPPSSPRLADEPPVPAVESAPGPRAAKRRAGRVLTVDAAVKDLDLIRPSRQKLAEDFTVPLAGGQRFRLSEHRGKAVLVNFWATWCPPCREEMPAMERLWQQHRDQGFLLVAVSVDSNPDLVNPFVAERKFTFPIGLDPKLDLGNAYGVRGLPSSFLIDRQGTLVALAIGPRAWDNDAAHSLIEGLTSAR